MSPRIGTRILLADGWKGVVVDTTATDVVAVHLKTPVDMRDARRVPRSAISTVSGKSIAKWPTRPVVDLDRARAAHRRAIVARSWDGTTTMH